MHLDSHITKDTLQQYAYLVYFFPDLFCFLCGLKCYGCTRRESMRGINFIRELLVRSERRDIQWY